MGGVAGGASVAARLRRLDEAAQITIFEKSGYVSFANCGLPYYLGGEINQWSKLQVTTPKKLKAQFNLDIHIHNEVISIDRAAKTVGVKDTSSGEEFQQEYDELVLAVGCEAVIPRSIPGVAREGHFALRNLEDTSAIEQYMAQKHPKRLVVCGGGFIGLEVAEQLKIKGLEVHVVEAMDQVMAPMDPEMARYIHNELNRQGIHLHLSDPVASFEDGVEGEEPVALASDVLLKSGARLPADMVILAMGVRPSTKLAGDAGLELTARGHIKVDDRMRTSDEHIWAVGDAVEVRNAALGDDNTWAVALGGPANRQGRLCADNIARLPSAGMYKGTIGSYVVKVFDLTAAGVGVNEKILRAANLPYKVVYLHPTQHAGYYPNAQPIHLKLLFDHSSGKIYGAQAIGKEGVEKRIDVISTAMHTGMQANELADLELCYAPPYGSARDPVNQAGMIASNIMSGLAESMTPLELMQLDDAGAEASVLDVRESKEVERDGPFLMMNIARVNVPLGKLREALPELLSSGQLDPHKEIIVACKSGQRAHVGARMLRQLGVPNAKVLSGSWLTASVCSRTGGV